MKYFFYLLLLLIIIYAEITILFNGVFTLHNILKSVFLIAFTILIYMIWPWWMSIF